jgi:hypothetical protein
LLDKSKQWIFNSDGEVFEYRDNIGDEFRYVVKLSSDGMFINKG